MSEFKPITTQEELDGVMADRLRRKDEKLANEIEQIRAENEENKKALAEINAKYEEASKTISGFETEKTELVSKIQGYETNSVKMRIAQEVGLPYDLASRLTGADEETIRADAEKLYGLIGVQEVPPLKQTEETEKNNEEEKYKKLLQGIKGDE